MDDKSIIISFFRKDGNIADFNDVTHLSKLTTTASNLIESVTKGYILKNPKANDKNEGTPNNNLHVNKIGTDFITFDIILPSNFIELYYSFLKSCINTSIKYLNNIKKKKNGKSELYYLHDSHIKLLSELGVRQIAISLGKKIKEWPVNIQSPSAELPSENRYFSDLKEGLHYLNEIIKKAQQIITSSEKDVLYYGKPIYVFRGITRFYDDDGNGSEERNITIEKNKVENDVIKSSLAVRLRDTSKDFYKEDNYTRATYVNLMEDTIRKAKNMYPQNYPADMSDLDILADVQHNGGATGLVDFSKNLLTSIWFACNADHKYNGYVYCYNIMEDMISNDALTYIRPEDENKSISELLALTIKETNISSDFKTKFFIWEPSKRNNRIARQDSVFVLGIGKFRINEHRIKVIEIPATQKSSILTAMKAIFNISGNSVYSDYIGFANNLNKLRPYRKMSDSAYSRGFSSMIKGHYSSALAFLKLAELEVLQSQGEKLPPGWDKRKKMELHFSLAICYKKLSRDSDSIKYRENAIIEYREAVKSLKELLSELSKSDAKEKKKYYKKKITRAYNEIVDLQYHLQRYEEAINTCFEIIDDLKNKNDNNSKYSEISITELRNLAILKYCREIKSLNRCKDLSEHLNKTIGKRIKIKKSDSYNFLRSEPYTRAKNKRFDFLFLLNWYYLVVNDIICFTLNKSDDKISLIKEIECIKGKWRKKAEEYFELQQQKEEECNVNGNKNSKDAGFFFWKFTDIKREIDSIEKGNRLLNVKSELQDLTAEIISIRDLYEMYDWRNKKDI